MVTRLQCFYYAMRRSILFWYDARRVLIPLQDATRGQFYSYAMLKVFLYRMMQEGQFCSYAMPKVFNSLLGFHKRVISILMQWQKSVGSFIGCHKRVNSPTRCHKGVQFSLYRMPQVGQFSYKSSILPLQNVTRG